MISRLTKYLSHREYGTLNRASKRLVGRRIVVGSIQRIPGRVLEFHRKPRQFSGQHSIQLMNGKFVRQYLINPNDEKNTSIYFHPQPAEYALISELAISHKKNAPQPSVYCHCKACYQRRSRELEELKEQAAEIQAQQPLIGSKDSTYAPLICHSCMSVIPRMSEEDSIVAFLRCGWCAQLVCDSCNSKKKKSSPNQRARNQRSHSAESDSSRYENSDSWRFSMLVKKVSQSDDLDDLGNQNDSDSDIKEDNVHDFVMRICPECKRAKHAQKLLFKAYETPGERSAPTTFTDSPSQLITKNLFLPNHQNLSHKKYDNSINKMLKSKKKRKKENGNVHDNNKTNLNFSDVNTGIITTGSLQTPKFVAGSTFPSLNADFQLNQAELQHVWRNGIGQKFNVRTMDYKIHGQKSPSDVSLFELVAMDMLRVQSPMTDIGAKVHLPSPPIQSPIEEVPPLFIVCVHLPTESPSLINQALDAPGICIIFYFVMNETTALELRSLSEARSATKLLVEYCSLASIDPEMRSRFKTIGIARNIDSLQLPSLIQKYNGKPTLITKSGSVIRTSEYMEMDINILHWRYLARFGLDSLLPHLQDIIADVGFVIEGRENNELPECMLGAVQLFHPNINRAIANLL